MDKVWIECCCKDCIYFKELNNHRTDGKCTVIIAPFEYQWDVDYDDFCSSASINIDKDN